LKRLFNKVAESDAVSQIDWAIASAVDTVKVTSSPEDERKLLVGVAIDE